VVFSSDIKTNFQQLRNFIERFQATTNNLTIKVRYMGKTVLFVIRLFVRAKRERRIAGGISYFASLSERGPDLPLWTVPPTEQKSRRQQKRYYYQEASEECYLVKHLEDVDIGDGAVKEGHIITYRRTKELNILCDHN
jgi:hypothetical protein